VTRPRRRNRNWGRQLPQPQDRSPTPAARRPNAAAPLP